MAYITFSDTQGAATLTPYPNAGNTAGKRFRNWQPFTRPAGEGAWALGDGRHYRWRFRTDYGATFDLPGIPSDYLDIALRLQDHLLGGGACTVYTQDANTATYTDCRLAPEGDVVIEQEDARFVEYVMRLSLVTLSSVPMLCEY